MDCSILSGRMDTKPIYNQYLNEQTAWKGKWDVYLAREDLALRPSDLVVELTPFHGMDIFDDLDKGTRQALFLAYMIFIAEAQILLEQILVFGFRQYRKNAGNDDPMVTASMEKLLHQEFYHLKAFRCFLRNQSMFDWPTDRVMPRNRAITGLMASMLRWAPLGILLPGAKLEAFSLAYNRMLRDACGDYHANSWSELNYLHHIDESYHVPLEYDIYASCIDNAGPVRTLAGTIVFVLFLQYTLLSSSASIVRQCFPDRGPVSHLVLTARFIKWAVRMLPAYDECRKITRRYFESKKPRFGAFLKIIHW